MKNFEQAKMIKAFISSAEYRARFGQRAALHKVESLVCVKTLKALANFSPGFALKPWVKMPEEIVRNPAGVARLWG